MRLVLFYLVFQLSIGAFSQAYTDVSIQQGVVMQNIPAPALGHGLSFYDFDKDGWDDITFSSTNDSLVIYHNLSGTGFERIETLPFTTEGKQPVWVDYDNDGDADIMWTKRGSGTVLYRNDGNMVFTNVTANLNLPATLGVHIYGQSWGDYDKDGLLDVYLCTYNSNNNIRNYLLHNNGDGTFTDVALAAGVNDGLRLTFQSVWQDFNMDGWPDLYVINDFGQGNELYLNNGDGTFTAGAAAAVIMGDNLQPMSNSVSDFENDGDWDIYVSNAFDGNVLFVNDGNNVFTESAVALGVAVNSYCWGANWVDYDNDRDDDLHVTTSTLLSNNDVLFTNNGDGTFTNPMFTEFDDDFSFTYSSAKGDFNHDGYYDLIVTAHGDSLYQLMENTGGDNNWVKLTLEGTFSNRDAIGTLIEYFVDGQSTMKYTRVGENYLAQNSQHEILGLDDAMVIDSLIITWPRGLVEKLYNIAAYEWLSLVEGENTTVEIIADNNAQLCEGGFITLDAGLWESILWSTDEETQVIAVEEPGFYTVQVTNLLGYTFSAEIEVTEAMAPQANTEVESISCWYSADGSITITPLIVTDEIIWNDESTSFTRENLGEGEYTFTLTNAANCTTSGSVELFAPAAITYTSIVTPLSCYDYNDGSIAVTADGGSGELSVDFMDYNPNALASGTYEAIITDENECELTFNLLVESPEPIGADISLTHVTCNGMQDGTATVEPTGGTGELTLEWFGLNPLTLEAGVYVVSILDENECSTAVEIEITQPDLLLVEVTTTNVLCNNESTGTANPQPTGGTEPYDYDWGGANPEALVIGSYTLDITDANGCEAQTTFNIDQPEELTATSEHEDVSIGLGSGWASVTPDGGTPPYEYLWSNSEIDSLIEEVNPETYYCIITDANGCEVVVEVVILFDNIIELNDLGLMLYPNPANHFITIAGLSNDQSFSARITNTLGQLMLTSNNEAIIDISTLSAGIYYLEVEKDGVRSVLKWMKH